jgi:hypothetical protein
MFHNASRETANLNVEYLSMCAHMAIRFYFNYGIEAQMYICFSAIFVLYILNWSVDVLSQAACIIFYILHNVF